MGTAKRKWAPLRLVHDCVCGLGRGLSVRKYQSREPVQLDTDGGDLRVISALCLGSSAMHKANESGDHASQWCDPRGQAVDSRHVH